jgi:hypothetical protein
MVETFVMLDWQGVVSSLSPHQPASGITPACILSLLCGTTTSCSLIFGVSISIRTDDCRPLP